MAIVSDYTAVLAYLDNDVLRWNGMTAVGTPVIVTYSFVETADLPDPAVEFQCVGLLVLLGGAARLFPAGCGAV